jgi:hypothetical protein
MRAIPGRTFAAVAFTWKAAAPHRRQQVAAVVHRVAALRAASVDVTVIGCDRIVPAEPLAQCRPAPGRGGPEAMRGILAVLARRGGTCVPGPTPPTAPGRRRRKRPGGGSWPGGSSTGTTRHRDGMSSSPAISAWSRC